MMLPFRVGASSESDNVVVAFLRTSNHLPRLSSIKSHHDGIVLVNTKGSTYGEYMSVRIVTVRSHRRLRSSTVFGEENPSSTHLLIQPVGYGSAETACRARGFCH